MKEMGFALGAFGETAVAVAAAMLACWLGKIAWERIKTIYIRKKQ